MAQQNQSGWSTFGFFAALAAAGLGVHALVKYEDRRNQRLRAAIRREWENWPAGLSGKSPAGIGGLFGIPNDEARQILREEGLI